MDALLELGQARDTEAAGGKAAALSELLRAGANVPDGFVITTKAAAKSLDEITEHILAYFDKLGAQHVAVRSSGTGEDGQDASWAGQFDTFLNVTRHELVDKIRACLQSASSERSQSYAGQTKAVSSQAAVLVQPMVQSEVSGVAFSAHPVTGDKGQIVIEAGLGLGEAVVSGEITPDTYVISKSSGEIISKRISRQERQLQFKDGKNDWQPTGEQGAQQKLDDEAIGELTRQVTKIEAHFGRPQDIEWAWASGKLYILQSRPITTLP